LRDSGVSLRCINCEEIILKSATAEEIAGDRRLFLRDKNHANDALQDVSVLQNEGADRGGICAIGIGEYAGCMKSVESKGNIGISTGFSGSFLGIQNKATKNTI
jgi:hypothetical protein